MPKISISAAWCRAICLFTAIALAGLAVDLVTKDLAFLALGVPAPYVVCLCMPELNTVSWVWQDVFGYQTALNSGALFGIGAGQTTFLVTFSLIFLIGIIIYVTFWAWRSLFLSATFGAITAGICGNLYDRLGWHGLVHPDYQGCHRECHPWHHAADALAGQPIYAVRDWILCMIGTFHWPNFNIADCLLVCSVILLLLHALLFDNNPQIDNNPQTS